MNDEIYNKVYAGWGRTEAEADFRATGGSNWAEYQRRQSPEYQAQELANQQQRQLREREAAEKKEETDFLNKFRSAVEGLEPLSEIRQRVVQEIAPGYEGLKETAYQAGQRLEELPSAIRERAAQTGAMTTGQIEQRIGAKVGERLPDVQRLTESLSHIGERIDQAFALEVGDRENVLIPLRQEAAMISDRLNRSITGFTTAMQSQTDVLISRLESEGKLAVAELQELAENARAENQYFSSQVTEKDGRNVLMNMMTGEVIADLGPVKTGSGGRSAMDRILELQAEEDRKAREYQNRSLRIVGQ
jgi:hypothetical protein